MMDWFRLEHPYVLIMIPLLMGILGFVMLARLRKDSLRIVSFVVRSVIIIALCLVLSGFQVKGQGHHLARLYLVDNSGSVFLNTTEVMDAIERHIELLEPEDQIGVIVFGRDMSIEVPLSKKMHLIDWSLFTSHIDPSGTDIEQVLKGAIGLLPDGYRKEIYLFTDGHETNGRTDKLLPLLQKQGIRLYTIPTGPEEMLDIKIDSWQLPEYVSESEPILGKLVLSGSIDTTGTVYLYQDNKLIRELKNITLFRDKQTTLTVELPAQEKVISIYEVRLATAQFREFCQENNLSQAIVQKTGKTGVLYITNRQEDNVLGLILKEVDEVRADVLNVVQLDTVELISLLTGYEVIVLDNLSIGSITRDGLKPEILGVIEEFVQEQRKGLVVLGGKSSFGLGEYQETILEDLLPVWAKPKDTIGLVIILDASGSMAEKTDEGKVKFRIARQALEETLTLLGKQDKLEVIVFNQDFDVIYPIQSKVDLDELNKQLKEVKPTGSTAILKPIRQRALKVLAGIEATKKHVILISDGESTVGETIKEAQQLGELLSENKISISTIATGAKINEPFLKALSGNETNGRFYHLENIEDLDEFLKKDLYYYKGLYREAESLNVKIKYQENILKDIEQLPGLQGYCRTTLKDRGRLIAAVEEDDDPLVASWQYGRGRVVAFTSSVNTNWAGSWLAWDQMGQFITQLLRWVAPAGFKTDAKVKITTQFNNANDLHIRIEVPEIIRQLRLKAYLKSFSTPADKVIESDILQVAPRNYEIVMPELQQGTYLLDIVSEEGQSMNLASIPIVVSYAVEWQNFGPELSSLKRWSGATGGRLLRNLDRVTTQLIVSDQSTDNKIYQGINSFLVICALILLLIDLMITRPFSYA